MHPRAITPVVHSVLCGATLFLATSLPARAEEQISVRELVGMPLEELLNVNITTASKLPERREAAPSTVYVVTEEQIKRLGLRDLKDILAIVPGVDTIDPHFFLSGGQRGFMGPFNQTLLLINGREINNLIAGETFISNQFRAQNIKQVEVINGPGSVLYGANAGAGVINIITKDVEGVEVTGGYGSWDTREINVQFGKRKDDLKIHGSVSFYQSDGEDFAGFLSNTNLASPLAANNSYRFLPNQYGYRNDATAIPVSLLVEKSAFYAGAEYYLNETGRGTSGIQWDYTEGSDHRELLMAYGGVKKAGLWDEKLDLKLEYRYYWEVFWGDHTEIFAEGPLTNFVSGVSITTNATPTDVENSRGFYSNKNSDGSQKHVANFETTYHFNENNTLVAGLNFERAAVVSAAFSLTNGVHPAIGLEQQQPAFTNYKVGVYAQDQARLFDDCLTATLGVRYDHHERYGDTFNPRSGLVYQPVESSVFKLLYGEAFREPTVFEIRNSQVPGADAIKPMKVRTVELGWHQYLGKYFKNEAVGYYTMADDVIVADNTTTNGISNAGKLDAYGFENILSFRYERLSGFVNYSYTHSQLDEPNFGTHRVYDIPEHKANLALMYEFMDNCSLGLLLRYRSDVDTEYHAGQPDVTIFNVPGFVTCDLTLSIAKLPWFEDASLDIIAKNLLDKTYYDPEPRAPAVVQHPQEGRSIFVRLTIRI